MDKLSILKVLKPQGLKGELKCLPLTERTEVFDGLTKAFCDGKEVRIISSKYRLGFVYICIENVNSIDDAEKWRGKEFFVDKEQFGTLDENTFFIDELEGLEVFDLEGNFVGNVLGVENYGATDILEIKDKWATYLVPFIEKVFVEVDIKGGKVVIDAEQYKEHRT